MQELCHTQPAAKWAPPTTRAAALASPAAAVELEVARSAALDKLRRRLGVLCMEQGLKAAPLLAFERWRFACAWAEEQAALTAVRCGVLQKPVWACWRAMPGTQAHNQMKLLHAA